MAGSREDGTSAENRAHHPNRKVDRATHELWMQDRGGYDWLMGEGTSNVLENEMQSLHDTKRFMSGRVQPYGHNKDRYFSPSSPDFSGDTQYERATHPAYKGLNAFGEKK
jgi:hypothetical protein